MNYYQKQSGIALIAALLAVAIATTAAVYLTGQNELYKRRTFNLLNSDQSYQYALGMEAVAMSALYEDFKFKDINTERPDIFQPLVLDIPEIEGGLVMGQLTDLQGLFNLNSLISTNTLQPIPGGGRSTPQPPPPPEALDRFRKLISQFENSADIIDALVDWTDRDINPRGIKGAEDQYYLGLERPYRTANRPITHISELRLIKEVNDKFYTQLRPFITVLPPGANKLNVNTAPAQVLMTLTARGPGMTPDIAAAIVTQRELKPYETEAEFLNDLLVADLGIAAKDITVKSEFFLLEAEARINGASSTINSILYRDPSGKVRVYSRFLKAL